MVAAVVVVGVEVVLPSFLSLVIGGTRILSVVVAIFSLSKDV